jgi:hypothetical protein
MPSGVYERTEKHKMKIGEAHKDIKRPPRSEKYRKKLSEIAKFAWACQDIRRKMIEGQRRAWENPCVKERHLMSATRLPQAVRENSPLWKGDSVCYERFHDRIEEIKGKPMKCENCGDETRKYYDWSCLDGDYKNVESYKRLCRSCHAKHDKGIQRII